MQVSGGPRLIDCKAVYLLESTFMAFFLSTFFLSCFSHTLTRVVTMR